MLRLNVVTPERSFLDEECLSVVLPGKLGQMQILTGHAALLAELKAGIIAFEKANKEVVKFMVDTGFVEVDKDQVNVLCEQARYKSEIDKGAEEQLLADLQEQMKKKDQDDMEQNRVFAELSRSVAKLSLFE